MKPIVDRRANGTPAAAAGPVMPARLAGNQQDRAEARGNGLFQYTIKPGVGMCQAKPVQVDLHIGVKIALE